MTDLISREEAIAGIEFGITYAKAINKETGEVTELFKQSNDELRKAIERIKQLPSAEPVQHGKWRQTYLDHEAFGERPSIFYCSACCACSNVKTNYCPNCGCRMDKE